MDGMAIVIAVGFIVCFLAYQMIKNHVLSKVSKAMQNQNYDLVLQLSEKTFYKRFMGSFVCDLYILRALLNKGDNTGFKQYLMEMLEKPYTLEKRKEVLDIYFYHFLFHEDKEWAFRLLEKIRETNDPQYITYNEEAYAVMIEHNTDLLDTMIEGIENKKYSGLGLGIAVFMVGMQYLLLQDKDNARTYFYNSLSCFNKKSFYYAKAKAYVDRLTEELGAEDLDY